MLRLPDIQLKAMLHLIKAAILLALRALPQLNSSNYFPLQLLRKRSQKIANQIMGWAYSWGMFDKGIAWVCVCLAFMFCHSSGSSLWGYGGNASLPGRLMFPHLQSHLSSSIGHQSSFHMILAKSQDSSSASSPHLYVASSTPTARDTSNNINMCPLWGSPLLSLFCQPYRGRCNVCKLLLPYAMNL